jgi:hypothetical protein
MGNPILIEKETQKWKVKSKIDTYPPKAGNRPIVDSPHIAIVIHYPIENGIPADKGNHQVTDQKGTQKDDDVGFHPKPSNRFVLTNTEHGHELRAYTDTQHEHG